MAQKEQRTVVSQDEIEEMRETKRALENLVNSPGWGKLAELLEKQNNLRLSQIQAADMNTIENILETKTFLNERRGILLALQLPQTIVDNLKQEIDNAIIRDDSE